MTLEFLIVFSICTCTVIGLNLTFPPGTSLTAVIETADKCLVAAGYTNASGTNDFWLCKVTQNGTIVWDKTYSGTKEDFAYAVVQTNDGGLAVVGDTSSYGIGDQSIWLIKTDSNGNKLWDKVFTGIGLYGGYSVIQTTDGDLVLAGLAYMYTSEQALVVKTAANGALVWQNMYTRTGDDGAYSIVQAADGGFALAGFTCSIETFICDALVIKIDQNGNQQWSKAFGGSKDDYANSIIQTSDSGFAIVGVTTSLGIENYDIFVIKIDNFGTLIWNKIFGRIT